jgi:hypothetical protein
MIYGHVPLWMALENPAFDEAVTRYYSFQHGSRHAAQKGELAHIREASELLHRDLPSSPLLTRLAVRVSTFMHGMEEALRSGRGGWFRRLDTTLSSDNDHEMEPVEYLFEAYFFLRKRDGQGSPLPTKTEVRHMAILIRSFYDCKLQHKLAQHLWGKSELTELELSHIVKRQESHDEHHEAIKNWTRHFKSAGLNALEQGKR